MKPVVPFLTEQLRRIRFAVCHPEQWQAELAAELHRLPCSITFATHVLLGTSLHWQDAVV